MGLDSYLKAKKYVSGYEFSNDKEKELYNLVLKCQTKSIKAVKKGIKIINLHNYSASLLGKYSKNFIHFLCHSLGIEVHDVIPAKKKNMKLTKGIVFTIEPGIYLKGKFGIRIEDDVYLGNKVEVLTKTKKNLIVVKNKK